MTNNATNPLPEEDPILADLESAFTKRRDAEVAIAVYRHVALAPRLRRFLPRDLGAKFRNECALDRVRDEMIVRGAPGEDIRRLDELRVQAFARRCQAEDRVRHANQRIIRRAYGHRRAGILSITRHGRAPRRRTTTTKIAGKSLDDPDPEPSSSALRIWGAL